MRPYRSASHGSKDQDWRSDSFHRGAAAGKPCIDFEPRAGVSYAQQRGPQKTLSAATPKIPNRSEPEGGPYAIRFLSSEGRDDMHDCDSCAGAHNGIAGVGSAACRCRMAVPGKQRSEERRVGKECRGGWWV